MKSFPLALSWFVAAFAGGLALRGADLGQTPWLVSRAAGIAAFALLAASVVLGLLLSNRAGGRLLSRPFIFAMHQFLSVLTLALVGVHGGALLFDEFLHFTPAAILVPFVGPYRPLWVGLGVFSGWAAAIVTASFWAKKWIGHNAWRKLHYVSFATYIMSLLHGLNAGTDSRLLLVRALYLGSAALIAGLLTYRILARRPGRPPRRVAEPAAAGRARPV